MGIQDELKNITAKYQKQKDTLRGMRDKGFMTASACAIAIDRLDTLRDNEKEALMEKRDGKSRK